VSEKPLSPGEQPDEFDEQRGEVQRHGSRRTLGSPQPLPPNTPPGVSPPDPSVVVSNFDTRPVGAYDFAQTESVIAGPGEAAQVFSVEVQVPDGYTAALRRVIVDVLPGAIATLDPTTDEAFTLRLMRNAAPIPNATVRVSELLQYVWPTHQVFGMTESFGLQLAADAWVVPAAPAGQCRVSVTFMGTLIPTKGRPPDVEIAGPPVLVRVYTPPKG
jgi:hypothetical protein